MERINQREIARRLARLREELGDLGRDAPDFQRRIEALTRSLEHLQADLHEMRGEAGPSAGAPARENGPEGENAGQAG